MKIQESGENYLETILMLEQKNGSVRSIDIANELEFSKPSVSRAMSILKTAGFITMDKNNQILLTPEGRQKAESVYERHCLLSRFLEEFWASTTILPAPMPAASSTLSASKPSRKSRNSFGYMTSNKVRNTDEI